MAGYPITSLKKADQLNGLDAVLISQDGLTKQAEKSVMDQAVIVTQSGAQSSGIIRREGTFVLKSSTLINFTLENATGRKIVNNVASDNAEAAAGWKVYIYNVSTINHTVIHGANSWTVAAGETLCFYWTGSKFTLHTEVMQDLTVKGNTKLPNVSAVQSITGSDDLAVITSGGLLKKTTPNDIKTALSLVNTTALNGALANYTKNNNIAKGIASPGWYRLCEIATGVSGAIIELEITTMYYNSETSSKKIIVSIGWTNHNIEVISCSDNKKITTQLRLNVKGTNSERKATIDVYYAMNQNNSVYTKINCKQATVTLKSYEAITEEVTGLIADITATSLSGALGDYSKCEKFTPKTTPTTGAGSKTFTWELPINAKSIKQVHIAIGGSNNIDEILILEFSKIYVTNITEIKKSSNITYSYDAQILTVTTSNAFWGDYRAKIITIA